MDLGAGVRGFAYGALAVSSVIAGGNLTAYAQAPNTKQPNIVVIMGMTSACGTSALTAAD